MSLTIISKKNKDHKLPEKKYYIILDQKERMYFGKGGFFVSDKNLATGINSEIIAIAALLKLDELREKRKMKVECKIIYE